MRETEITFRTETGEGENGIMQLSVRPVREIGKNGGAPGGGGYEGGAPGGGGYEGGAPGGGEYEGGAPGGGGYEGGAPGGGVYEGGAPGGGGYNGGAHGDGRQADGGRESGKADLAQAEVSQEAFGGLSLEVSLEGPDGSRRAWKQELGWGEEAIFECPDVLLWDCEHPILYGLHAALRENGRLLSERRFRVGFRTLERRGRQLLWNHAPLKLRGICYRERRDDREGTRKDLELFAEANINFIRGIYGPFSGWLLDECDELGFLVEDTAAFYETGQAKPALQDLPHCREDFLREARGLLAQGNHVCTLLWSLGHDCAWGANFRAAADLIRSQDKVRPLTFHLPMSIPEDEKQPDVWPVHYVDYRQPFDKCFDQMVVFHTPGDVPEKGGDGGGQDPEGIGYLTAYAPYEVPVLHEIWSPVACHNTEETERDPAVREFWGESIWRFAEKAWHTPGCLGGAVLAGVDEDGSFADAAGYEWGILDSGHRPKPEYFHLKMAYSPAVIKDIRRRGQALLLTVENRFLHTDLSQLRIWINGYACNDTGLAGGPGALAECAIVCTQEMLDRAVKPGFLEIALTAAGHGALRAGGEQTLPSYREEPCVVRGKSPSSLSGRSLAVYGYCWEQEPSIEIGAVEAAEDFSITRKDGAVLVENDSFRYLFSEETCLLISGEAGGKKILAGGPYLNCTRYTLGKWRGGGLDAVNEKGRVRVTISGSYEKTADICFTLLLYPDGKLETRYTVLKLHRHMPHTVKAEIGMDPGGLAEKGAAWLLDEGLDKFTWRRDALWKVYPSGHMGRPDGTAVWHSGKASAEKGLAEDSFPKNNPHTDDDFFSSRHHIRQAAVYGTGRGGVAVYSDGSDSVRLERAPYLTPEAVVNDRDRRMRFTGKWFLMDDCCGNYLGTETLGKEKGSAMSLTFTGSGIRLYGPQDINYGSCDIFLDGEPAAEGVSGYPRPVDFPGMSRGYEKRYRRLLFEVHGLPEREHTICVRVRGEKEEGAQNTYVSLDYAVLEGSAYPEGLKLTVNRDYNYPRLVRGCYMRPKVELIPGAGEVCRLRLLPPGTEPGTESAAESWRASEPGTEPAAERRRAPEPEEGDHI